MRMQIWLVRFTRADWNRKASSFMAYLKMSPRENAKSMLKDWVG